MKDDLVNQIKKLYEDVKEKMWTIQNHETVEIDEKENHSICIHQKNLICMNDNSKSNLPTPTIKLNLWNELNKRQLSTSVSFKFV